MCFCSGTQFKSSLIKKIITWLSLLSPVLSWSSTLFCLYTVWLEAHPPAVHSAGGFVKDLGVRSPLCVNERLVYWCMDIENAVDPYVQETITEQIGLAEKADTSYTPACLFCQQMRRTAALMMVMSLTVSHWNTSHSQSLTQTPGGRLASKRGKARSDLIQSQES